MSIPDQSLDEHWVKFPRIPEIEVEFKPHVFDDGSKGLIVDPPVVIDLGILGEFELGSIPLADEEDLPMDEQKAEVRKEVQVALERLLLRFAAVVLVKRGEGLSPVGIWYEGALREAEKL